MAEINRLSYLATNRSRTAGFQGNKECNKTEWPCLLFPAVSYRCGCFNKPRMCGLGEGGSGVYSQRTAEQSRVCRRFECTWRAWHSHGTHTRRIWPALHLRFIKRARGSPSTDAEHRRRARLYHYFAVSFLATMIFCPYPVFFSL